MCILGTSQIQDLDPSRVVFVLCSFSTFSLTHAPALYSYGLLASPGTDMPYPGSYRSRAHWINISRYSSIIRKEQPMFISLYTNHYSRVVAATDST